MRAGKGYTVLYVGHEGHEEAVGTMAVAPDSVRLVRPRPTSTSPPPQIAPGTPVALLAQTTLSHDEWSDIMDRARQRFPDLWMPNRSDLCFATTNRQAALKAIAGPRRRRGGHRLGELVQHPGAREGGARLGVPAGAARQRGVRAPRRPVGHRRRHRRGVGSRRAGRRGGGPPGAAPRAWRRSTSPTRTSTSPRLPSCATCCAAWPRRWPWAWPPPPRPRPPRAEPGRRCRTPCVGDRQISAADVLARLAG